MKCELVLTGNELLLGKIHDINGSWMALQLTPLGVEITRITIIPDDLDTIADVVNQALDRMPKYIITSGGLGPTYDDITIKSISSALELEHQIFVNNIAKNSILLWYQRHFPDKSESLIADRMGSIDKMASLPQGAHPLFNQIGTAPGVLFPPEITNGITSIISLPGIPNELQSMFEDHVMPIFRKQMEGKYFRECGFIFRNIGESSFSDKVNRIRIDFPEIRFKTHPRKDDNGEWVLELHITSFSQKAGIDDKLMRAYEILLKYAKETGAKILKLNPLKN